MSAPPMLIFNDECYRYRTWCCHSIIASKVVASLELVITVFGILSSIIAFRFRLYIYSTFGIFTYISQYLSGTSYFLTLAAVILLLVGLITKKYGYMIPYLVFCLANMVIYAMRIAASIRNIVTDISAIKRLVSADVTRFNNSTGYNNNNNNTNPNYLQTQTMIDGVTDIGYSTAMAVVGCFEMLLRAMFFIIVFKAQRYCKEKRAFEYATLEANKRLQQSIELSKF